MMDVDLTASSLAGANLSRVDLSRADLRYANLSNIRWQEIGSLQLANVWGVVNPPKEFVTDALMERSL